MCFLFFEFCLKVVLIVEFVCFFCLKLLCNFLIGKCGEVSFYWVIEVRINEVGVVFCWK